MLLRNAGVNIQNTQCDNPEDHNVYAHCRENFVACRPLGTEIGGQKLLFVEQ